MPAAPDPAMIFGSGYSPPVADTTCWLWTSGSSGATSQVPVVSGYPVQNGWSVTKSGVTPAELQAYVGVPLVYYGNPPTPVTQTTLYEWLRDAEDQIEQETSILLCQTWVASPPGLTPLQTAAIGMIPNTDSGAQVRGYDYDLEDNAYDFMFPRAQDEGWMYQYLRYRPVQSITYGASGNAATAGYTAVKNIAYVYPLLNQFFRVPPAWNVEDRDYGLIRLVPAANVQMLPLFAMQLAFMGFAESVPGALWYQYTAGLTPFDYQNRYRFMKQLILATASMIALNAIQGSINLGIEQIQTTVDGLMQNTKYAAAGPYAGLINGFRKQREALLQIAMTRVSGPIVGSI